MSAMTLHETYYKDLYLWGTEQIKLLKEKRFDELDIEHLIEEMEDMGSSQRSAVLSHLKNLLMHLLKWQHQSNIQSNSWSFSIINARLALEDLIIESPSLKNMPSNELSKVYVHARKLAAKETGLNINIFPIDCPYTIEQILNEDWLPN
jgi:hypothetical protein